MHCRFFKIPILQNPLSFSKLESYVQEPRAVMPVIARYMYRSEAPLVSLLTRTCSQINGEVSQSIKNVTIQSKL